MKRTSNIFDSITVDTIARSANRAFKAHGRERDVIAFKEDFEGCCRMLYDALQDGSYTSLLHYSQLTVVNTNGKVRNVDKPNLTTRIYQILFLEMIEPIYEGKDNLNGLNCKRGCGITATDRKRSVIKRLKHLFYDRTDLHYALIADQRKCYDHITVKTFRRELRRLVVDKRFTDFAVNVIFVNRKLPIGTPTSPMAHHIVMLAFDLFAKSIAPFSCRYADDNILAFATKEEAQQAKWRVQNFWWYRLGMRAKRQSLRVVPLTEPVDFCGYVYHRNGSKITDHNKGYVTIRKSTAKRARRCKSGESWASYFGLMRHADTFNLMQQIENNMKLRALTDKIKIDRNMDARNIDVRDLVGMPFNIHDYEIRYNGQRQPNWIKCLIGIIDGDTTKEIAREFHGNYQGIISFLLACEKEYGKSALLPIEDIEIENQCGYIFKGSTNQITYIENK